MIESMNFLLKMVIFFKASYVSLPDGTLKSADDVLFVGFAHGVE